MDINKIREILPHRYPFLLIDRVLELNEERIVALKNVTINEPFFNGHFPNEPVMPGVLIVEAMAQAGAVYAYETYFKQFEGEYKIYFMSFDKVKFRRPVDPGDALHIEASVISKKRDVWRMKCVVCVDGKVVCEGELTAIGKVE